MKGKGKGKDQSNNKDCPLQFPDLTMLDYGTCSKYSSILDQLDETSVSLGDLDELHSELNQLLMCTTNRRKKLDDEMQRLVPWINNKKNKPSPKMEVESPSSSKKSRTSEAKQTKKSKESTKVHQASPVGRPKSKNTPSRSQDESVESPTTVPKNQKSDMPSRFWESLKPYYCDITQEHIKFLEEWAKPDDEVNFEIPPLGKHYSYDWSNSNVQEEEREGAKPTEKRKCLSNSSSMNSADSEKILKKARTDYDTEEPCPFGPLTQRLVSCLIEENIMTSSKDTIDNAKDLPEVKSEHTNGNIIKSLNIGDPVELEHRIRRNLKIAGILPEEVKKEEVEEEPVKDEEEDEVLAELLSVQEKLKALSAHNLNLKQKLLVLAQKEMKKQELNKQLQAVDAEIMKMQRKMQEKPKKGTMTRKEEEKVMKILEQRKNILENIKDEENS